MRPKQHRQHGNRSSAADGKELEVALLTTDTRCRLALPHPGQRASSADPQTPPVCGLPPQAPSSHGPEVAGTVPSAAQGNVIGPFPVSQETFPRKSLAHFPRLNWPEFFTC